MVFSFLKKRFGRESENSFKNSVSSAFTNVRTDMDQISKWVHHFKNKHDGHDKQFNIIHSRLNKIERMLSELSSLQNIKEDDLEESFEPEEKSFPQSSQWDTLTETQQRICWLVARLQTEMPDQWISLKYLAQEIYPDKDYNKVRSTLSAYINVLEELGYIDRKRNGKQTYVYSTVRNPCQSGKIKMKVKVKNEKAR